MYHSVVSHAYKLAFESGKANKNPASLVRRKKENNERVRFLELEEGTALRAVTPKECPNREPEFDLAPIPPIPEAR